ncbi:MAG: hypothetical protein ACK4XY_05735 [Chloroherpetonaceae bacterium]
MNKSHLRGLFFALAFVSALSIAGCSEDSNTGPQERVVIEGSVTFTYNGQPVTDAANWPNTMDTSAAFPGRMKIAFVPLDPATRQPRQGPVSGIPGLGNTPGISFSELQNGRYTFTSEIGRDGNGTVIASLPKDIYGVYPTYVNPFYTGQASQQFLTAGVVADLRNQTRATVQDQVEIKVAEALMQSGRAGTATLSGTVTSTTGTANWPNAPVGPPQAWANGSEFLAIMGERQGAPPGPPAIFIILDKPASGNSVTYARNLPLGTYQNVKIYRFRVNSAVPGGFETVSVLAEFRHPVTQQNSMTMDNTNRQGVWNATIAP